jgi:hypothetical protein
MKELRASVSREEFITLTRDPLIAILLKQLVYWRQRVTDFDLFLREEKFPLPQKPISPHHKWFYKTVPELIKETMLRVTPVTLRRYINFPGDHKLQSLFVLHFQNDLVQWERFCARVESSPFLMGEGARKWRVSFDWVLCEENLLKVMEGNFDSAKTLSQKTDKASEANKDKEICFILTSIENPQWRTCCSLLDLRPESGNFVSLGELKDIAHTRFLEIEGDQLVWIGTSDKSVLYCNESLRLKMLPVVQKTFPNIRNLKTRLEETISDREEPFSSLKGTRSRNLSETGLSKIGLSKIGHSSPTHSQQRGPSNGIHLKGEFNESI